MFLIIKRYVIINRFISIFRPRDEFDYNISLVPKLFLPEFLTINLQRRRETLVMANDHRN